MKKHISLIAIFLFLLANLLGCSNGDITDKVVKDNINDLYLVILGEDDRIDINNLVVSQNEFDNRYVNRKYKAIFIASNYVEKLSAYEISDLNDKINQDDYWLIFYSKNFDSIKNFANKFGKTVSVSEQNNFRGYSMHFNKTQGSIQCVTHYTTESAETKAECNNLIKSIFRDMIENRYEDIDR